MPADDPELSPEPSEPAFDEPTLAAENPVPVTPVPPPVHKTMMVKKIPVKIPAGMVKVPKMPGVVRVKIPKALHQAPIPPKPQE